MRQNWLEWIVLAASVVAIVLLAGYLVVDEATGGDAPPQPVASLRLDEARESESGGWIVPVVVENVGDEAAEAVRIEATAVVRGGEESNEIDIDFLPAGSRVEVEFAFSARPEGEVTLTLIGWRLP